MTAREPEIPHIMVRWDVQDVMRALPELNYAEAVEVLHKVSDYWKPREIGLLRTLIVQSGAHSGEPYENENKVAHWTGFNDES